MLEKEITWAVNSVIEHKTKQATIFVTDKQVVKATFKGKRDPRIVNKTVVLTIGRPNYDARETIKRLKKEGRFHPGAMYIKLDSKKKK